MDEGDTFTRRATVSEAAELLGITPDAVRKRVERDKIVYERDDSGRLFVWVDPSEIKPDKSRDTSEDKLIRSLEEQNTYLREIIATRDDEIRRRDVIISQLTQRIPEIESAPEQGSASEPRESPITFRTGPEREDTTEATEQPGRVEAQPQVEGAQEPRESHESPADEQQGRGPIPDARGPQTGTEHSWWRRLFGG